MHVPKWLEPMLRFGVWLVRPKYLVGVFPICIDADARVLLIEKRLGAATGWQLPGGGKAYGVPLADAAVEELFQETGLAAYPSACVQLPVQCIEQHRDLNVPFSVMRWHGELGPRDTLEIAFAAWVPYADALELIYPFHRPMLIAAMEEWSKTRVGACCNHR